MRIYVWPDWTRGLNPYLNDLYSEMLVQGAEIYPVRMFRYPVISSPTIVHLNWADNAWVTISGFSRMKSRLENLLKRFFFWSLVLYSKLFGARVIHTVHNSVPHAWSGTEAEFEKRTQRFFSRVDGFVHLSQFSLNVGLDRFPDAKHCLAEHMENRQARAAAQAAPREILAEDSSDLLIMGEIRRRKLISDFLNAFLPIGHGRITIAGNPHDPLELQRILEAIHNHNASLRISLQISSHTVTDLVGYAKRSKFVLLTKTGQLNSGVCYLALSAGARVLLPKSNPANQELRTKYPSHVVLYGSYKEVADIIRNEKLQALDPADVPSASVTAAQHLNFFESFWQ